MATYYYRKEKTGRSKNGGTNYLLHVYKQGRSGMKNIGKFRFNTTSSYLGEFGEVNKYVAQKEGYKRTPAGYLIKRKDFYFWF